MGIGSRASHKLGQHSTTEPHLQPFLHLLFLHACSVHLSYPFPIPPALPRDLPTCPSPNFMPSSTFSCNPLSSMGAAHTHIGCRAICGSTGNLPMATSLKINDSPSAGSHRLPIAPQLGVGTPKLWLLPPVPSWPWHSSGLGMQRTWGAGW